MYAGKESWGGESGEGSRGGEVGRREVGREVGRGKGGQGVRVRSRRVSWEEGREGSCVQERRSGHRGAGDRGGNLL